MLKLERIAPKLPLFLNDSIHRVDLCCVHAEAFDGELPHVVYRDVVEVGVFLPIILCIAREQQSGITRK